MANNTEGWLIRAKKIAQERTLALAPITILVGPNNSNGHRPTLT
jgi:hypothetical protein